MLRRNVLSIMAVIGAFALNQAAKADIVYTQPSDFPNSTVYASQNDPGVNGNFATVYDNFTLGGDTDITDVHWMGGYFNPATQGTISSFELSFWADNAGQPGALLNSYTIAGNANETFVGVDNEGTPTFSYSALLPASLSVSGSTQYWLSIVPTMAFPPQWGWSTGTGGDGVSMQNFFGSLGSLDDDMAFDLTGRTVQNAVPEPGSVALMVGMAVSGGLVAVRRRRR